MVTIVTETAGDERGLLGIHLHVKFFTDRDGGRLSGVNLHVAFLLQAKMDESFGGLFTSLFQIIYVALSYSFACSL